MTEKLATFLNNLSNPKILTITVIVIMGGILIIAVLFLVNDSKSSQAEVEDEAPDFVPAFLLQAFPDTDWSQADESLAGAVDGGPGKDGIPAIDDPQLISLNEYDRPDDVQAIMMRDGDGFKVYPYNILVWHEIVNDTVDGQPVSVTFCPLCGSAIVFERTLPDGTVTTMGVSGALLKNNLVMYDRESESLWQQSTGEALAGKFVGQRLELVEFQLTTLGEARQQHPDARVLSEDTGHSRDYARNPYSGYEDDDEPFSRPNHEDERYPSKDIFVAFRVDGTPVAMPWLKIEDGSRHEVSVNGKDIVVSKQDGELAVTDEASGETLPFYFEMWFSWATQNQDKGRVFDPDKE